MCAGCSKKIERTRYVDSESCQMAQFRGIWIVTPTLNQLEWLKLCVSSVRDQSCGFDIRVHHHVQDGGSNDGTVKFLKEHNEAMLKEGRVSKSSYTFSYVSERDNGMYDAINRGWRRSSNEFDILGHLNSDEQYLEGALRQVISFFREHAKTDIVFGDVVVLDGSGEYICSRRVLNPSFWHTRVFSLNTFTAATFVRRSKLLDGNWFFDTDWRAVGDRIWMLERLKEGASMEPMGVYSSVFVDTGKNLALSERARREHSLVAEMTPIWMRRVALAFLAWHRVRRLLAGHYTPRPFTFSRFVQGNAESRVVSYVAKPTGIWRGRM